MQATVKNIEPLIISSEETGQIFYESQPKQSEFHAAIGTRYETNTTDFLFGGSAGPGKSFALRWEAHNQCIHNQRLRGLLLRSSYPELERTHIAKLIFDFPAGVLRYNSQKHTATYFTDSVLELGYAERKEDFLKYLSAEYDFIMIDEETTIPFEIYLLLRTRLRTSQEGYVPFIAGATNPGGISHRQVKSYFIDKDFDKEFPEMASEYNPDRITYIHATIYDNKIYLERDPDYLNKLKALPPFERKRFLEGSWEIAEGQFFKKFAREVHVIRLPENFVIPAGWEKVIGMDYGSVTTAIALAKDPFGTILAFSEWTAEEGQEVSEKVLAFKKWRKDNKLNDVPIFCDVTLFAKLREFGGENSYKYFLKQGVVIHPVSKKSLDEGAKFRIFCNRIMKDLLYWETDKHGLMVRNPKFYIVDGKCPKLSKTIPVLLTDENDDEQISEKSKKQLHWYDGCKYGIISFGKKQKVSKEDIERLKKEYEVYAQSQF